MVHNTYAQLKGIAAFVLGDPPSLTAVLVRVPAWFLLGPTAKHYLQLRCQILRPSSQFYYLQMLIPSCTPIQAIKGAGLPPLGSDIKGGQALLHIFCQIGQRTAGICG